MLGSPSLNEHMKSRTHFVDKEDGVAWFYVKTSNDLIKAVANSAAGLQLCAVASDYQACLQGQLEQKKEPGALERSCWRQVAAWFAGGKADPTLTMLRLQPAQAAIWAMSRNPLRAAR